MTIDSDWIKEKYKEWNKTVFDDGLPSISDVEIEINMMFRPEIGEARCTYNIVDGPSEFKLIFTNYFDFEEDVWKSLLMHELIHLFDYSNFIEHYEEDGYDNHGEWLKEMSDKAYAKEGIRVYPCMKSDIFAFPKRRVNNVNGVVGVCYDPDGDDIADAYFAMEYDDYIQWWNKRNRYAMGFKKIEIYQTEDGRLPVFALLVELAKSDNIEDCLYDINDDICKVISEHFEMIDDIERDLKERTKVMKFDEYCMNEIAGSVVLKETPTLLSYKKFIKKKFKDGFLLKSN